MQRGVATLQRSYDVLLSRRREHLASMDLISDQLVLRQPVPGVEDASDGAKIGRKQDQLRAHLLVDPASVDVDFWELGDFGDQVCDQDVLVDQDSDVDWLVVGQVVVVVFKKPVFFGHICPLPSRRLVCIELLDHVLEVGGEAMHYNVEENCCRLRQGEWDTGEDIESG